MRVLLELFTLFLIVKCVVSEVELVCPSPIDTSNTASVTLTTYTELTPGPRTIVFKETRAIEGAPFKLSILRNGQEYCVLADHIPWQSGNNRIYYVTVNIPNRICRGASDSCKLVVWQIDTQSSNGYCSTSMGNCAMFNSTAPIKIRTNNPINNNVCPTTWDNWPYDPMRRYTSNLMSVNSSARATGTFHLIGKTILYNVNVTVPFGDNFQPRNLKFVYFSEGTLMEFSSVDIPSGQTAVMGSWTGVSEFAAYIFRNSSMYVQVMASGSSNVDKGLIMGMVMPQNGGANGFYGLEYGVYTESGWLSGGAFVGPNANATLFTQPHGPCLINMTRYYGCMLSGSDMGGGTVAMSLTGNRLWFSMDMYNVSSPISSVMLDGTVAGVDAVDLTSFWSDGYRLRGLTDVSSDIGLFMSSGLIRVSISTVKNGDEMTCVVNEGMISILDSLYEAPPVSVPTNGSATAFLYFAVDGSLNYQITLNNLTSPLILAHIHGPAYQGIASSNIPLDISEYIAGEMGWGWNIQGTWRNMTASELRYMKENLCYLNMHTPDNTGGELRGQLSPIGDWICPSPELTNHCYWTTLSVVPSANVMGDRTPMGVGGVVIDRYERLQYSLALWYIPAGETVTVQLMSSSSDVVQQIQVTADDDSDVRDYVKEIYGVFPDQYDGRISSEQLRRFENGDFWFNVTSDVNPMGLLSGNIPPLMRSRCTGLMSSNISVGGEDGWVPTGNEYPSLRALRGDKLKFTFSSPDNLYEMANKNRLAGCVFTPSTATILADAETTSPNTYYYNLRESKYYFFSSSVSCQNQKMRLTVYAVDTVSELDRLDSGTCTRSLYSYSEDQRTNNSSNALAGAITATIIGLIIGIVIAAMAIVIGVFVMIRGKVTSGDSGDMAKKP